MSARLISILNFIFFFNFLIRNGLAKLTANVRQLGDVAAI
jgi:hypothetical protein